MTGYMLFNDEITFTLKAAFSLKSELSFPYRNTQYTRVTQDIVRSWFDQCSRSNVPFPNYKHRVCVPDVSPRLLAYSADVTAIMYPGLTQ